MRNGELDYIEEGLEGIPVLKRQTCKGTLGIKVLPYVWLRPGTQRAHLVEFTNRPSLPAWVFNNHLLVRFLHLLDYLGLRQALSTPPEGLELASAAALLSQFRCSQNHFELSLQATHCTGANILLRMALQSSSGLFYGVHCALCLFLSVRRHLGLISVVAEQYDFCFAGCLDPRALSFSQGSGVKEKTGSR